MNFRQSPLDINRPAHSQMCGKRCAVSRSGDPWNRSRRWASGSEYRTKNQEPARPDATAFSANTRIESEITSSSKLRGQYNLTNSHSRPGAWRRDNVSVPGSVLTSIGAETVDGAEVRAGSESERPGLAAG